MNVYNAKNAIIQKSAKNAKNSSFATKTRVQRM